MYVTDIFVRQSNMQERSCSCLYAVVLLSQVLLHLPSFLNNHHAQSLLLSFTVDFSLVYITLQLILKKKTKLILYCLCKRVNSLFCRNSGAHYLDNIVTHRWRQSGSVQSPHSLGSWRSPLCLVVYDVTHGSAFEWPCVPHH